jgi:hypothetical protein
MISGMVYPHDAGYGIAGYPGRMESLPTDTVLVKDRLLLWVLIRQGTFHSIALDVCCYVKSGKAGSLN